MSSLPSINLEASQLQRLARALAHPGPIRLLVAEHSPGIAHLLRLYLGGAGYAIDLVADPGQVIDHFQQNAYDLVLIDLQMESADAAIRRLRDWEHAEGRGRNPILALPGEGSPEQLQLSLAAGCDGQLSNPLIESSFLETIALYLQGPPPVLPARPRAEVPSELRRIVPAFLEAQDRHLGEIENAIQSCDFDRIRTVGHDMKGTGSGYGFVEITEIGKILEAAGRSQDVASIRSQLVSLAKYLSEVDVVYA
jgi:CheY-like chemotaxis protein